MKAKATDKPLLTPEQVGELRLLLAAIPPDADESDARFIELLEYWEGCHKPWNVRPTVPCYRCHNRSWATAGVDEVVAAIKTHIERS